MKNIIMSAIIFLAVTENARSQSFSSKLSEIETKAKESQNQEINPDNFKISVLAIPTDLRSDFLSKSKIGKISDKVKVRTDHSLEETIKSLPGGEDSIKSFKSTGNFIFAPKTMITDIVSKSDTLFLALYIGKKDLLIFKRYGFDEATITTRTVEKSDFPSLILAEESKDNANPCALCEPESDRITYDYSQNKLETEITSSKVFRHGIVGKPFNFFVRNINPFRDSIIISQEAINYADTSSLSLAFSRFSVKNMVQEGENKDVCKEKIADIYRMGVEIKLAKNLLAQLSNCTGVCERILEIKNRTEAYFKNNEKWKYSGTGGLESFIASQLSCADQADIDSVNKILSLYYTFRNTKDYFVYKIPQLQNVDEYIFNLSILPKKGSVSNHIVDHQPIKVPLVGGFKIDGSSGLFMTKLMDDVYTLRPDSSNGVRNYRIFSQAGSKTDMGVAAYIHFYPRISTWLNIGLTMGAGLSISKDPKVRYLPGASLLLGRNGRLALNVGSAIGYVQRIANGYADGTNTSVSDASLLTSKVLKSKVYWSVSFSLPIFNGKLNLSKAKVQEKSKDSKDEDEKEDEDKKGK